MKLEIKDLEKVFRTESVETMALDKSVAHNIRR